MLNLMMNNLETIFTNLQKTKIIEVDEKTKENLKKDFQLENVTQKISFFYLTNENTPNFNLFVTIKDYVEEFYPYSHITIQIIQKNPPIFFSDMSTDQYKNKHAFKALSLIMLKKHMEKIVNINDIINAFHQFFDQKKERVLFKHLIENIGALHGKPVEEPEENEYIVYNFNKNEFKNYNNQNAIDPNNTIIKTIDPYRKKLITPIGFINAEALSMSKTFNMTQMHEDYDAEIFEINQPYFINFQTLNFNKKINIQKNITDIIKELHTNFKNKGIDL